MKVNGGKSLLLMSGKQSVIAKIDNNKLEYQNVEKLGTTWN